MATQRSIAFMLHLDDLSVRVSAEYQGTGLDGRGFDDYQVSLAVDGAELARFRGVHHRGDFTLTDEIVGDTPPDVRRSVEAEIQLRALRAWRAA